jgi:asparagine synthase (glutamine-hydrolysing)
MPGIFGLAGQGPAAGVAEVLFEMASRLRHHAWYRETRHVDETAGLGLGRMTLGFVNASAQPAFNEARTALAVMDGELYDYPEQRRRLSERGHVLRDRSHAEILVRGFESEGPAFFRGLHGKFVAALWDARAQRLTLVNDRFGMRPLFYARPAGRLLFASEIKALLADPTVSRKQNLRGIAQFFTYGQLLGEDTLLDGVRLLPAAGCLTYDVRNDRLTVERYWRLETRPAPDMQTPAQALERLDQAFGEAVGRCSTGSARLGLSLSGGLDSRTILAAVDPSTPLTTVSVGVSGSMDHRSAAELACLTFRPHHQCHLGEGFLNRFEEHLRRMVRLTDGHYLSQCIVMPTLPVYRDLGIEILLRGHAGELMHMRKAYNFSLDDEALGLRDDAGLERWLFRHLQTYMLQGTGGRLFAPQYREQVEALARDSLRDCLRECEGTDPPVHRIWHLFLTQRLRRETATSLVKFGSLVETRVPYLDNELIDALFACPPALKLGEEIQAHILRRRQTGFLRVVNVNTGARMEAGRLGRAFGKLRLKILAKLGVRGYQPYERLGLWLRTELRPLVQRLLLSDRCLERGLVDPQTVKRIVANHFAGGNHTFLLMALMIFEMGQRELTDSVDLDELRDEGARRSYAPVAKT